MCVVRSEECASGDGIRKTSSLYREREREKGEVVGNTNACVQSTKRVTQLSQTHNDSLTESAQRLETTETS